MILAAWATVASGWTVMAGVLMSSYALVAPALATSDRRCRCWERLSVITSLTFYGVPVMSGHLVSCSHSRSCGQSRAARRLGLRHRGGVVHPVVQLRGDVDHSVHALAQADDDRDE